MHINWNSIGLILSGLAIGWCSRGIYSLWRKQRLSRPISREEQERFLQDLDSITQSTSPYQEGGVQVGKHTIPPAGTDTLHWEGHHPSPENTCPICLGPKHLGECGNGLR